MSTASAGLVEGVWFVVGASVAFAFGGALMRWSVGAAGPWPTVGFAALFVAGALLLGQAVRTQGLSVAYVLGLGLEALVAVALGRWLFGEHLTVPQAVGVVLIAAGIAAAQFGQ